jgi:hypothetical protein
MSKYTEVIGNGGGSRRQTETETIYRSVSQPIVGGTSVRTDIVNRGSGKSGTGHGTTVSEADANARTDLGKKSR